MKSVDDRQESLEQAKRALRGRMKDLRARERGGDGAIAANFFSLPETAGKERFFVYMSFGTEADTMPVIEGLFARGKSVLLPRVEGRDMRAVPYEKGAPLRAGAYGIQEPLGPPAAAAPQVVVLPLLAADERGGRLGYGGGYYDRYLTGMSEKTPLKVGYCYDFQVVEDACAGLLDVPLDVIVTDKRVIRVRR